MWRMILLVATALLALCISEEGLRGQEQPETVLVPTLDRSRPRVAVRVDELHKLTPLNWAMLIDFDLGKPASIRNHELFKEACKNDPMLEKEVHRILDSKWTIEFRSKQLKQWRRGGPVPHFLRNR